MATLTYHIVTSEYSPYVDANIVEISMETNCTVNDLPRDVAPDSIALQVVEGKLKTYIFTADGEWKVFTA